MPSGLLRAISLLIFAALLQACNSGSGVSQDAPSSALGQVTAPVNTPMTRYAAARAADQVSFGATPALVDAISTTGLEVWINSQMALPLQPVVSPSWVTNYSMSDKPAEMQAYWFPQQEFFRRATTVPDQLRMRVAWALMQFIPVNGKVQPYGMMEHFNLLQKHAFGNYANLLKELTTSAAMGHFLDNAQNRPVSSQCPSCAPNENYARELMQLFALGVVKLNADGSTVRDAAGKPVETYTQEDVEELAGALTGWRFAPSATRLPDSNWANFGLPMEPETWSGAHDFRAKTILGVSFPAGRDARQELDAAVALMMNHQNIAPFVSLRMIQHLVTSNPSPQYIARMSAVFRNNGKGVAGDMAALIKAILLDPEARLGDRPGADTSRFGKLREPVLWYTGLLRGLGCTRALQQGNWRVSPPEQTPFNPPSVFSFYLPTDRAPRSNLLAPEQKLISTNELTWRLGMNFPLLNDDGPTPHNCDYATLGRLYAQSTSALIDEIGARWFRGAVPASLRMVLEQQATTFWRGMSNDEAAVRLTVYALTSPFYGVMR